MCCLQLSYNDHWINTSGDIQFVVDGDAPNADGVLWREGIGDQRLSTQWKRVVHNRYIFVDEARVVVDLDSERDAFDGIESYIDVG